MRKHPILFPKFIALKKNETRIYKILDEKDSIYDHAMEYCVGCRFEEGCGSLGWPYERFCKKWLVNVKIELSSLGYVIYP
jgi:hypothetical protein